MCLHQVAQGTWTDMDLFGVEILLFGKLKFRLPQASWKMQLENSFSSRILFLREVILKANNKLQSWF